MYDRNCYVDVRLLGCALVLLVMALPLGLIFARILTDHRFRYCT